MTGDVPCPRCRASGDDVTVPLVDDTGECPTCGTRWHRLDLGQMVAG